MKIIHFSDTHLGYSEGTKTDTETGINLREADIYRAFSRVVDYIAQLKPDLIVHSGDLFDNPRPSNRTINFALKEIKRISKLDIPFVLISGNHSTPRVRTSGSIFESFALFDNIRPVYGLDYQQININGIAIHCLPHMLTEQEMQRAFNNLKPNPRSDANIIVAHAGITAQTQYKMGEFNEQIVPFSTLAKKRNFDYIALGHYHRNVKLADNAYYAGSTERFSFDDAAQDKGFLLVNLDKGNPDAKFMPLDIREMFLIEPIDCADLTVHKIIKTLEKRINNKIKDNIVHVTLANLSRHKYVELDFAKMKDLTSQAAYVKFDYQLVTEGGEPVAQTAIGTLTTEFETFLSRQKIGDLNKARLKEMGIDYLTRVILPEEI